MQLACNKKHKRVAIVVMKACEDLGEEASGAILQYAEKCTLCFIASNVAVTE